MSLANPVPWFWDVTVGRLKGGCGDRRRRAEPGAVRELAAVGVISVAIVPALGMSAALRGIVHHGWWAS